jgi:hypothetical protein
MDAVTAARRNVWTNVWRIWRHTANLQVDVTPVMGHVMRWNVGAFSTGAEILA